MSGLHPSILALKALGRPIDDSDYNLIATAHAHIDALPAAPNAAEVTALVALLPANGDTASGLNWTILHRIEASADWPIWTLLEDTDHEWQDILRTRLKNGGIEPPKTPIWRRIFGA